MIFGKASKKRYRTIVRGIFTVALFKDCHYFGCYTISRKYAVVKTKIDEQMKGVITIEADLRKKGEMLS